MWVKSTDIGDKSEMSPKSVSFTLSTIAVVEVPNPNQIILCEIPWNLLVCTMYSCEAIEVWPGFFEWLAKHNFHRCP